ncbi:hypothetical protein DSL64_08080 [Dyadobacter luteus]|uniref:Bestrophin n=1 Tax=Dyadobacter luteus TaxID=2259619 RepID=A0A3D8YHR9_9BACT|nr:bestrophin family ion channel [Dyadobacter luteus]REA62869.1 hypothetical protein DSL64_08080 [Dyadobacter luteus]
MILEKKLPIQYLIGIVKYELIVVLTLSLITHFGALRLSSFLPEMPLAIPAFLGTSITVLLSFKMNQSYDRWWEARKVWGAITNDSRSLVMQLQAFVKHDQAGLVKKIAYRQVAWGYALGSALRGNDPIVGLDHLLDSHDVTHAVTHQNKPLALLQLTVRDVSAIRATQDIDVHAHIHLQETIIRLTDSMGAAERINRTVFPSAYRLILHLIIYLFVITLAISLSGINNVFVIPLLLLISAGFFCIEKIAYHLQDPFKNGPSDIAVTDIATNIEISTRELLGEVSVPFKKVSNDYYVM